MYYEFSLMPYTVTTRSRKKLKERVGWALKILHVGKVWKQTQGKGIKVAILDSGYARGHPDLQKAVKAYRDFTGQGIYDGNGHGCIAPTDTIYTSIYGLQQIQEFFDRVNGITHFLDDGSIVKDLSRFNIYTRSFKRGYMIRSRVLAAHKLHYSGDTYDIKTTQGVLKLTPWHPIYVCTSRRGNSESFSKVRADELTPGQHIVCSREGGEEIGDLLDITYDTRWVCVYCGHRARGYKRKQCYQCNKHNWHQGPTLKTIILNEDLAYLIGLILSDGHIQKDKKHVEFCNKDRVLMDEFIMLSNKLFGIKINILKSREILRCRINRKSIVELFCKLGIPAGKKSNIITLPELISKSPRSVIYSFIAGLVDGDGCIDESGRIRITTGSEKFVKQLKMLLLTLGVRASCSNNDNSRARFGGNSTWVIRIGSSKEIHEACRHKSIFNCGYSTRKTSRILSISRTHYDDFVYDLTVEESHNYIANGFVVSNTHTAGIVGARANKIGVVGVAPKCKLLIAKVLNNQGRGKTTWIVNGIKWAADQGADIISMSLGSGSPMRGIKRALGALPQDTFIVAAAGNSGPRKNTVGYPAAYRMVISVGAITQKKKVASWSSRGNAVDVVAPGDNIVSCFPPRAIATMSGTSMATPVVAGVMALALAKHRLRGGATPINTRQDMLDHLIKSCIDLGEKGKDPHYGYGLINPNRLLAH